MDTIDVLFVFAIVIYALLIILLIIGYRVAFLKRQLTDLRIKMLINQREETMRHQLLVQQIQQHNKLHAVDDLQHLFLDKIKELQRLYPALTETDIQVLTLIGLGVENADILQLTGMSKRTYYKRRQLIAQRMNTTASLLDEFVRNCFIPK